MNYPAKNLRFGIHRQGCFATLYSVAVQKVAHHLLHSVHYKAGGIKYRVYYYAGNILALVWLIDMLHHTVYHGAIVGGVEIWFDLVVGR